VLVLSGGVSAGVLDLVPGVLNSLGVRQIFHKVNLKPGKPVWFGVRESAGSRTLVFGLPGNPVSSLVCFELFVRPAVGRLAGRQQSQLTRLIARLTDGFERRGDRPTYHPAVLNWPTALEPPSVRPLRWQGSGDLRTLVDANALVHFPVGQQQFVAGDAVEVYVL
jgi:molybdopterin molybdotransferase